MSARFASIIWQIFGRATATAADATETHAPNVLPGPGILQSAQLFPHPAPTHRSPFLLIFRGDVPVFPMLLVNGKQDHLSPIGNLYLALESGPLTARVARVYADDGHIASKNEKEWGPVGWRWMREQLSRL